MLYNLNVIIPSAKLVPEELQSFGKLPAILYPVNQRPVFDFLYEQYKTCSIRIILYEGADKVSSSIGGYKNVELVALDRLQDLGYTLDIGLEGLVGNCVINFADTIIKDDMPDAKDFFFYSKDFISDKCTYFEEQNGVITNVIDKYKVSSNKKGNLFVGVFGLSDTEYFRNCLEKSLSRQKKENLGMSSFYYALQMYSHKFPLRPVMAKEWLDIGHLDRYYNSQLEVKAREFNHIKIDKDRGILTKYSDDKDKFLGEIKWYLKLPREVEYVAPRIFDYSLDYNMPYVSMEYYSYHTLHELFLFGDISCEQWKKIFLKVKYAINDFGRYTVTGDGIRQSIEDMYLNKTVNRLKIISTDKRFSSFFENPIEVNGVRYVSLTKIIEKIKRKVPELLFDVNRFTIIHGDLCFSNIMVDNNYTFIKLIDPRGSFGKYDIYGDPRYELAKLFHSVDGKYDFIINDQFRLNYDSDKAIIKYKINDGLIKYDLYQAFIDVFSDVIGKDIKKIHFIEALLFLSMIPLHGESESQQMVMLATGLDILNRVVNIKNE